jgi:adenine-specific DNA-methyltransferase
MPPRPKKQKPKPQAEAYRHPESESLMRPEVGTQAQFRKKKPPATYRFDSSLSPALDWDGQNSARERGEQLLKEIRRLSTQAIIETLKGHRRPEAKTLFDFFADPQHSITDQVLRAYEYGDKWVNRMILGDALVAMNSLLHFESLGGQVQMIYMDPP